MKKLLALIALLVPALASAATVTVNWTAPTTAVDGSALSGVQAITSYQVWISTATIPTTTTTQPTATVTGTGTSVTQNISVSPGGTLFARVKACNSAGCSDFSAESSKAVPVNAPGVPTSVTITLQVGP